eukprot:6202383-Pleurochrysis_carterae.AAC.1
MCAYMYTHTGAHVYKHVHEERRRRDFEETRDYRLAFMASSARKQGKTTERKAEARAFKKKRGRGSEGVREGGRGRQGEGKRAREAG